MARLLRRSADDELRRNDFDRFPKGTTCFVGPRSLLLAAFAAFRTRYATLHANDDTPILRGSPAERIHIAPAFACGYRREESRSFLGHAIHRGTVFVDGHGRRSRASSQWSSRSFRSAPRSRRGTPTALARAASRGAASRRPVRVMHAPAVVTSRFRNRYAALRGWARRRNVARARAAASMGFGGAVILVVFGTTGELIKLAPVLLRLDERGHRYVLATTGQQVQQIPAFLEQFGLRQPDLWLARGARGRDLRVNTRHPALGSRRSDALVGANAADCGGALRSGRAAARARPRRHDDDRARQR